MEEEIFELLPMIVTVFGCVMLIGVIVFRRRRSK